MGKKKTNYEVMVTIRVTTYNQEKYIARCLDSLICQDTKYKYEIVVHDDASTDNTEEIIKKYVKKYPQFIIPIFQEENKFSQDIPLEPYIYPYYRGKYIAMCEGDDFWTDKKKLQKQIDFLESHQDFVLCGHAAYFANEDGTLRSDRYFNYGNGSREITIEDMIDNWAMATNSMVYRASVIDDKPIPYRGNAINGDVALMTFLALHGRVFYMDELMSAYRVGSIDSTSWISAQNQEKAIEYEKRFIEMMRRFDDYTGGKYHEQINRRIDLSRFSISLIKGDIDGAKKHKNHYKELSPMVKAKLIARKYVPHLYQITKEVHWNYKRRKLGIRNTQEGSK